MGESKDWEHAFETYTKKVELGESEDWEHAFETHTKKVENPVMTELRNHFGISDISKIVLEYTKQNISDNFQGRNPVFEYFQRRNHVLGYNFEEYFQDEKNIISIIVPEVIKSLEKWPEYAKFLSIDMNKKATLSKEENA